MLGKKGRYRCIKGISKMIPITAINGIEGVVRMTAIKDRAIGYINEMPEEKVHSLIEIIHYLAEEKHPLEISSIEELYKRLDEGLDDVANGRGKPLAEAMKDIREKLTQKHRRIPLKERLKSCSGEYEFEEWDTGGI
jgi:hypothetical protein